MNSPGPNNFRLEWPLFDDYTLQNGMLCARNAIANSSKPLAYATYETGEQASLAVELARVNRPHGRGRKGDRGTPRERALLFFAQEFGPLGQVDPFERVAGAEDGKGLRLDEIDWCLGHAAVLDLVLTLCGALTLKCEAIVDCQLKALSKATKKAGGLILPVGSTTTSSSLFVPEKGSREVRVWSVVEQVLDPNLNGRRRVSNGQPLVVFSRLYSLAYSQIGEWLGARRFGQCENCASFFPLTDQRMRYCPPITGDQESRCAMRDRARRRLAGGNADPAVHPGISIFLLKNFEGTV